MNVLSLLSMKILGEMTQGVPRHDTADVLPKKHVGFKFASRRPKQLSFKMTVERQNPSPSVNSVPRSIITLSAKERKRAFCETCAAKRTNGSPVSFQIERERANKGFVPRH